MKILYLSAHGILEYDEVSLLTSMGHDVFTIGDIWSTERPKNFSKRQNEKFAAKYDIDENAQYAPEDPQGNLDEKFISMFDVCYIQHIVHWATQNWEKFCSQGVRVFFRTGGQTFDTVDLLGEQLEGGMRIIPYCEAEIIPDNLGEHPDYHTDPIPYYKNPEEFTGWTGGSDIVLTVTNDIGRPNHACHPEEYKSVMSEFDNKLLIGRNNAAFGDFTARMPYWMLKDWLCKGEVYFHVGTRPAQYTLSFIEAMMTGLPMVTLSNDFTSSFIENGSNGFVSDDMGKLRHYIRYLLESPDLRRRCSERGRTSAIKYFGLDSVRSKWKKLLSTVEEK